GSVEFLDGATSLGTVPLDATGHATFTTSGLTVGPHDITAKYSGDSNFNPITALLTQTVNPDTTPPEAYNQFDPTTKNVLVFGRDGESGVPPGPVTPLSVIPTNLNDDGDKQGSNDQGGDQQVANDQSENQKKSNSQSGDKKEHDDQSNAELRTYLISDLAGNSLTLVENVKKEGHEIKVKIVSLQYNNGPIIASSKNKESFDWSLNTDGSLKKLDQEMKVGKDTNQKEVEAKYDGKKNKTTIELEKPKPETKIVKDGLVLLRMATSNGNLNIEIPP
ncbi:MAG: Ig-like domain repeat protein, partial [Thaumarchaeota archaeon]